MTSPLARPPVGPVATQLRDAWYVVARSSDLRGAPIERTVAGQRLALFRGPKTVHAVAAQCPHRGANLAEGSVIDGCVRCPYHGWSFDGSGRCVHIPSNPADLRIPAEFAVASYRCREQDGFVWVSVGDPPADPPDLPWVHDRALTGFTMQGEVGLAFDWWVENVLDVSHVAIAHGGSYAAEDATVGPFEVERWEDDAGYTASVELAQRYGFWTRLLHQSARHFTMQVRIEVSMPGTVVFCVDMPGGRKQVIVTLATPVDDVTTRYFIVPLRNYFRWPGANAIGRYFTQKVLDEDIALGHASLAPITLAVASARSVRADTPSIEFLRLLRIWSRRELSRPRL